MPLKKFGKALTNGNKSEDLPVHNLCRAFEEKAWNSEYSLQNKVFFRFTFPEKFQFSKVFLLNKLCQVY